MNFTIRVSRRATHDIDSSVIWMSQFSPRSAFRWHDSLWSALRSLEQNPHRFTLAEEAEKCGLEIREMIHGRRRNIHRILFTIDGQIVNVLRVRHHSQDRLESDDLRP